MNIRANTANNSEKLKDQFRFWLDYNKKGIQFDKQFNTLEEYKAERKAILDAAKTMLEFLISPAGAMFRDNDLLDEVVVGLKIRKDQLNQALKNSSLNKNPQQPIFNSLAYKEFDMSLCLEWIKLEKEFDADCLKAKAQASINNIPASTASTKANSLFLDLPKLVSSLLVWNKSQPKTIRTQAAAPTVGALKA